jgi:putative CocE/NonD family hydrolase
MARRATLGLAVGAVLAALFAAPTPAATAEGPWEPGPELYGHVVTTDVPVEMPDGRTLRAAIYTPTVLGTSEPAPGEFPVILVQTPYGKSVSQTGVGAVPPYLVHRGYLGVAVDVAGTGGSEGQSMLFGEQEAKDGAELVEWAADLPGSNGTVGTLGGSYLGIDQVFTAAAVGPNSPLKAIFPIVTASDPYRDLFSAGGIVNMESSLGLIAGYFGLRTLTPLAERPTDPLDALRLMFEHGLAGIPFELTTGLDSVLQQGRVYDGPYWQERAPQRVLQQVVDNGVPAYIVGGQYDVFQRGEPLLYSGLQNAWSGRSVWEPMAPDQDPTSRYQLLTGPWDHGNAGAGLDLERIQLQWFDHWLKGRDTGITDTETPLHVVDTHGGSYDLTGYPDRRVTPTAVHLQPGSGLAPGLPASVTAASKVAWKGVSLSCQRSLNQWGAGIFRDVYEACKQHALLSMPQPGDAHFDTAVLADDLRLAGPVGLRLRATSTRPEAMFVVTLQDVAPDGTVTDITAGAQLGSARALDPTKSWPGVDGVYQLPYHPQTKATEQRITPGKVTTYDVELRPAYTTVPAGHRLRLLVQTGDLPHLLPPPMKLLDLLGGVYAIQTDSVSPSTLSLPILGD